MERVHTLEAQLAALESARVADQTAAEREVVREERSELCEHQVHTLLGRWVVDRKKTSLPFNREPLFGAVFIFPLRHLLMRMDVKRLLFIKPQTDGFSFLLGCARTCAS